MFKHYKKPYLEMIKPLNNDTFLAEGKISTIAVKHAEFVNEKLLDAIVQAAMDAGCDEVFMLDKDQVRQAITEYVRAHQQCKFEKKKYNICEIKNTADINRMELDNMRIKRIKREIASNLLDEIFEYIRFEINPEELTVSGSISVAIPNSTDF